MDLVSHVMFAAAIRPTWPCVVASVLPDVALWQRRRQTTPPRLYLWLHAIWPVMLLQMWSRDAAWGWSSHLILDLLTHEGVFALKLFYPWRYRCHHGPLGEWELFNSAWIMGFGVVLCAVGCRMVVFWSHVVR